MGPRSPGDLISYCGKDSFCSGSWVGQGCGSHCGGLQAAVPSWVPITSPTSLYLPPVQKNNPRVKNIFCYFDKAFI